jgi:hypothetical protein
LRAPELGLIEGYYGAPWQWTDRVQTMEFLAGHGYCFHIYAPKADAYLRRRWREPHPQSDHDALAAFSARCAASEVRFGLGLSPFELYRFFDAAAKADLARKLDELDALGVRDLAILFDDMRGDVEGLARDQITILHWIAERTKATRLILCPTYYSDDPVLPRVFGACPPRYLEELGADLDPAIALFWTGEEVCSRAFSPGHLERVANLLRRKPLLWDNYPVNDGPLMSQSLHLRAFTGRPASIGRHIAGHSVNPACQAVLSRIPALTLAESYREGDAYEYGAAFARAAEAVLGPDLGDLVTRHLPALQDTGLDRLGDGVERLRGRYAAIDHPGAREIVAWLDGAYRVTRQDMEGV